MYEFTSRVRYSEIRPDLGMKLSSMAARMQDCCVFQSEAAGCGPADWKQGRRAWIILSWQIRIHDIPVFNEAVTTRTWAYYFKNMRGDRNFTMSGPDGRLLAEANSHWCYFDLNAQRPVRVPEEDIAAFGTEPKLPHLDAPRKIALPREEGMRQEAFAARLSDIDTNRHVNNLHFIDMACAYLPDEADVKELRVEYARQCRLGEMICPVVWQLPEGTVVSLGDEAGKPYANCMFLF